MPSHRKLTSGHALGQNFYMMHYGSEVQLYWSDGELNARELQRGDDPQQVANDWKEELFRLDREQNSVWPTVTPTPMEGE